MRIAVLALQGAFIEHEQVLQRLGVETFELRQLKDWQQPKDGLILPGGESTVQMRLLNELGLFAPIREAILDGMPVFGTCAGMILLSEGRLGTMHIQVRRNAYGRQLGSFHTIGSVTDIGSDVPMKPSQLSMDISLPPAKAINSPPLSTPSSTTIPASISTSSIASNLLHLTRFFDVNVYILNNSTFQQLVYLDSTSKYN